MIKSNCKQCEKEIVRRGSKAGVFCSISCKAEWQRSQKPVTKAWLYQKYVNESLGTVEIGKLVARHPKRVYEWLVDLNIPIRKRAWSLERDPKGKPYQQWEWLEGEYLDKKRSVTEIATEQGVSIGCIMHFMRVFNIERRNTSEVRAIKHWALSGDKNGMFGRTGEDSSNWKGGVTPERQQLYSSVEWANASKAVWKRDNGTCQRCDVKHKRELATFHIHHIVPFALSRELRTVPANLILLCECCHYWVHSRKNTENDFLKDNKEYDGRAGDRIEGAHNVDAIL